MEILRIVLICIAGVGITNILMHSTLLTKFRQIQILDELLSCPMCAGFWAGVITVGLNQISLMLLIPPIISLLSSHTLKTD